MKSEQLLKKIPFLKALESNEEDVLMILMRIGGNLEAIQGFKGNPEIGPRINENQSKLLQQAGQIILGLQAKLCDLEEVPESDKDQKILSLESELKKTHELVAVLTEQKSQLQDLLEASDI